MAERLNNTIETQINDGNTIVSQIVDNNQPLQTVIQDVPQVQTVLQNGINVSSQINAPFVEVTSVNGKTGDVITEPVVGVFEPNHYYLKNTMIAYDNNLYYAKETFTSGSSFNANDWHSVEGSQITVDSALSSTSENPVQNKVITNALNGKNKTIYTAYNVAPTEDTPEAWKTTLGNNGVYITWYNATKTFTNQPVQYGFMRTIIGANDIRQDFWVQTSGVHYARTGNYQGWSSYAGTTGVFKNLGAQPGNGTLTIQKNGTNVQTFTANQSGNATANISVPTKTSEIENDSDFLATEDLFTTKSGTNINFTESEGIPFSNFSLKGNTSQQTYTGKNLMKYPYEDTTVTRNGITFTDNGDGSVTANGTATSEAIFWITKQSWAYSTSNIVIPAGTYTIRKTGRDKVHVYVTVYGKTQGQIGTFNPSTSDATFRTTEEASLTIRLSVKDVGATISNFVFRPQIENGSTSTAYEPYVGGIPAPNPDYPQAVQTVTGENVVKISDGTNTQSYEINLGKNLLDEASVMRGYELNGTTGAIVESANWWVSDIIPVKPNTPYTSSGWDNGNTNKYWYRSDNSYIERTSGKTVTSPSDAAYMRVNGRLTQLGKTIMVEQGSQATSYAAYFAPIELCKIGDYQDYIYENDGKWYVHKEVGKADLSEQTWAQTTGTIRGTTTIPNIRYVSSNQEKGFALAEKYILRQGSGLSSYVNYFAVDVTKLNVNTGSTANPTGLLYYALATPTDTEITNEALVEQLEAILSQGYTYAGTNNITTVIAAGNAQGELEITYPKFFSKVATASSLGSIRVGDGLNVTPEGTLSTQLGFTTESTSGNTKIIRLQDGTTTSYPITTKEAILGLEDDKFDASFLYDCTLDSTAFTQEQAEALKDAILADKEILIYEVNQSTNKGQYKPYYVSASEDSAFKTINVQYINQAPAKVMFSFMSINGADWTLTVRTTPL